MNRFGLIAVVACALLAPVVRADADTIMGEYAGTFYPDKQVKMDATADVVAEGGGRYRIVIDARSHEPGQDGALIEVYAQGDGERATLMDGQRFGGYEWKGEIKNGHLSVNTKYGLHFELDRIESKSPNAGMEAPRGAVVLLAYEKGKKADLSKWTNTNWKALDDGVMECVPKKGSNKSKQEFGDLRHLHVEFRLPLEPGNRGQGRANSGVYVCDSYEVQILDSFGLVHTSGDCGGLYNVKRAAVNACLPPETWQTYDIVFRAPRADDDGNTSNPRITVIHNGVKIHDDVEIPQIKKKRGPLQLQDHKHAIQFRNIWLLEG